MLVIDMNNSLEFKDVNDLYNRVKPALYSKIKELEPQFAESLKLINEAKQKTKIKK